jgi:hypothetical protein
MNDRVFAKAGDGLKYRDEYTLTHIPDEGAWLKRTRHVDRRLLCGDLVEVTPSESAITESAKDQIQEETTRKTRRRGAESEG